MLLLDCGGIFPIRQTGQRLVADLSLQAMNLMDYAGINVGWNELSLGIDTLKELTSNISFPLITSNLVDKDTRLPLGKKYLIRRVGNVNVGIIGIMPAEMPKALEGEGCAMERESSIHQPDEGTPFTLLMEHLEIISPEKAVKEIVAEIRPQTDMIILLSQCGFEDTVQIVKNTEGIDLAIYGGKRRQRGAPDADVKIPILAAAYQGRGLGYIQFALDENGKISQKQEKMIRLNDMVLLDEQVAQITGDDINRKIKQEEQRKMEEEAKALLKLSPYEYYERLMKQQAELGGTK